MKLIGEPWFLCLFLSFPLCPPSSFFSIFFVLLIQVTKGIWIMTSEKNLPVWRRRRCPRWNFRTNTHHHLRPQVLGACTSPARTFRKLGRVAETKGVCNKKKKNMNLTIFLFNQYHYFIQYFIIYIYIYNLSLLGLCSFTKNNTFL